MQFSVPQFTDVEDKIVGPLTLKQFLILLAGGGIILLIFRLVANLFLFLIFALPVAGVCAFAAFGTYNGKSLGELILSGLSFFAEPNSFVFRKSTATLSVAHRVEKHNNNKNNRLDFSPEEKLSRLHKLAYILDQDIKTEEELIKEKYIHLK